MDIYIWTELYLMLGGKNKEKKVINLILMQAIKLCEMNCSSTAFISLLSYGILGWLAQVKAEDLFS